MDEHDERRATLAQAHELTGVPKRTLQHWLRAHTAQLTRQGYPIGLLVAVLAAHQVDVDPDALAFTTTPAAAYNPTRRSPVVAAPPPAAVERVGQALEQALTKALERRDAATAAELAALREEVRQLRADLAVLGAGTAALRDDLAPIAALPAAVADLRVAHARRSWWAFWRP